MKKRIKISFACIFLIFYFAVYCIANTKTNAPFYIYDVIAQYDSIFTVKIKEYNIPGAAYAVVNYGEAVFIKCYGVRNVKYPEPVNEHTIFRLASLSKGITAVLAGILVDYKVLNWDDPVIKYLPDFHLRDPKITRNLTIRHILSHTSGLPSYAGTELLENNISYVMLLKNLTNAPILALPGEQFNYQNVLFSLIGDIFASLMDTSYEQLVNSFIFESLGMKNASVGRSDFLEQLNRASPHVLKDSLIVPVKIKQSYYNIPPAAGINASIADMIEWLKAMMGYRKDIVSPAILEQVSMPYIKTAKETRYFGEWENLDDTYYGLGLRIFDYSGTNLIYHGGYVQGFRSEIAIDPVDNVGIVILMNSESPFADICVPLFFDLFLGLTEK